LKCDLEYFPNSVDDLEKQDALARAFLLLIKGKGIALGQSHRRRSLSGSSFVRTHATMQNYDIEEDFLHGNDEDNRDGGEREATDARTDIKSFKRIHLLHGSVGRSNAETKHSERNIWKSGSTNEREAIKEFWVGLAEKDRRALIRLEKDAVLKKK
jgi:hypothetical protein